MFEKDDSMLKGILFFELRFETLTSYIIHLLSYQALQCPQQFVGHIAGIAELVNVKYTKKNWICI